LTSPEGEPPSESASSDARGVCPVCGAVVEPFQEYCLICGARLGETGSAGLAARWRHALPLADKDWGWPVLIALTIAILASVFAILTVKSDDTTTLQVLGPSVRQTTAAATTGTDTTGRSGPPTVSAKADLGTVEAKNGHTNGNGKAGAASALTASLSAERTAFKIQEDAPSCADCGSIMVRNGSCYKCLNCGSTSGCS